ncbi:MAG: hypothetical protein CL920_21665 [Deltaproteobacteria bacterium]|nr:hypothetical protein [Deltaproteobacteria bacterium]MBU51305.1 hypothetical protein [Deltaproteobacteria bacterium]
MIRQFTWLCVCCMCLSFGGYAHAAPPVKRAAKSKKKAKDVENWVPSFIPDVQPPKKGVKKNKPKRVYGSDDAPAL